jgi:hypothetical protein
MLGAANVRAQAVPTALPPLSQTATSDSERDQKIQDLERRIEEMEKQAAVLEQLRQQLEELKKAPKPAPSTVKVGGYLQLRLENNQAKTGESDLRLRRLRLKIQGDPSPYASTMLQFESCTTGETMLDGYVDVKPKNAGFAIRVGQFSVPFGYETLEPHTQRYAPEFSKALGALFPGNLRDRGVMLVEERKDGPAYYLAVLNGNNMDRDNNNGKDLLAHVEYPIGSKLSVGASAHMGKFTTVTTANGATTRTDTDRRRWGGDFKALFGSFEIHGEYMGGQDLGASFDGGYVALAMPALKLPGGTPFMKYDWYDPSHAKVNDYYSRWSFGYAWDMDKFTRLTLAQEVTKDRSTPTKDNVTSFQVQTKF